ncbi:MAG: DUF4864 domain-containing protein [Ramlibacter sp.]|nr:DUF4864 domain-containing protein [Ramlibacter sp.]
MTSSPHRRLLVLSLLAAGLGAAAPPPASAGPVAPADMKAVRAVVQGQLDAFATRDAEKAFSYAAPNVRERLGSAERFMAMVRNGYPVVYDPAHVAFLVPERLDDGTVVQRLQMTDARGTPWLATYTLQQQKDKAWLITGCEVHGNTGRVA